MGILTDEMKQLVTEHRQGFVATVDEDVTPNLSPKGTMVVLDDDCILFDETEWPKELNENSRADTRIDLTVSVDLLCPPLQTESLPLVILLRITR